MPIAKKKKTESKKANKTKAEKKEMPRRVLFENSTASIAIIILVIAVIVLGGLYLLQPTKFEKEKEEAIEQARTVLRQQVSNLESQIESLKGELTETELKFEHPYANDKYGFELVFPSSWGEISTSGEQVVKGEPFLNQLESNEINLTSSIDSERSLRLYIVRAELKGNIEVVQDMPVHLLAENDKYIIYYGNYGVLDRSKCDTKNYDEEACKKYNQIDRESEGIIATFKFK